MSKKILAIQKITGMFRKYGYFILFLIETVYFFSVGFCPQWEYIDPKDFFLYHLLKHQE